MRHGSFALVATLTAAALTGCGNAPLAPSAGNGQAELKVQASPTVATNMGPFEGVSGCTSEFSSFYASAAFDVNTGGEAVGLTACIAGETLTFRWSEIQGMEQLANFAGGYPILEGQSINNSGTIAGIYYSAFVLDGTITRPVLWTATNSRVELVSVITCDPPQLYCGAFPGSSYINDKEVVAGWYDGAFRWTAATGLVHLPILGARSPVAINSDGDILASGGGSVVLLRKSGVLLQISGISPTSMNNKRDIVGYSGNWPNPSAVKWTRGKGVQPLGTLGGTFSVAYDINDRREVVGASTNPDGEMRAFYWTKSRGMVDLGPGIAYAISDEGHMVGIAPTGLFPPDLEGGELWQATLWRGTAGVQPASAAAREGTMQATRAIECLDDERNWQSKPRMLRCLADK